MRAPAASGRILRYTDGSVVRVDEVARFLDAVMREKKLDISHWLPKIHCRRSFFLVAATGLGKTVAVPLHVLLRHAELRPLASDDPVRVWVIEPKIAIARDLMEGMNNAWENYAPRGSPKRLFGSWTNAAKVAHHAPIVFVTTGIFSIAARNGWLRPERDVVLVDEAHSTLCGEDGVELGVAVCRIKGIPVHFMSATVDTSGLGDMLDAEIVETTGKRFPVWVHNTGRPLLECVEEVVRQTLITPDFGSEYFPKPTSPGAGPILQSVREADRAKGILIICNSYRGAESETERILARLTRAFGNSIRTAALNGAIARNKALIEEYEGRIATWRRDKSRFAIVATSVVEMGVTVPDLDFVLTMDSGYEAIATEDELVSERGPLDPNALLQRVGRVGRLRPGIAYVTNDEEASYSTWPDGRLNTELRPLPVRPAMTKGPLLALAYHSFVNGWDDESLAGRISELRLPSRVEADQMRMAALRASRDRLRSIGAASGQELTPVGRHLDRFLGRARVELVAPLLRAFLAGRKDELLFWLVLAAASDTPIHRLCRDSCPLGTARSPTVVQLRGGPVFLPVDCEPILNYNLFAYFSSRAQVLGSSGDSPHLREALDESLSLDAVQVGVLRSAVLDTEKRVNELISVLREIDVERCRSLFGQDVQNASAVAWPLIERTSAHAYIEIVEASAGRVRVRCSTDDALEYWIDKELRWTILPGVLPAIFRRSALAWCTSRSLVFTAWRIPRRRRGEPAWDLLHIQRFEQRALKRPHDTGEARANTTVGLPAQVTEPPPGAVVVRPPDAGTLRPDDFRGAKPNTQESSGAMNQAPFDVDEPTPQSEARKKRVEQVGAEIVGGALTALAALAFLGLLFGGGKKPFKPELAPRPNPVQPAVASFNAPAPQSGIPVTCGVLGVLGFLAVVVILAAAGKGTPPLRRDAGVAVGVTVVEPTSPPPLPPAPPTPSVPHAGPPFGPYRTAVPGDCFGPDGKAGYLVIIETIFDKNDDGNRAALGVAAKTRNFGIEREQIILLFNPRGYRSVAALFPDMQAALAFVESYNATFADTARKKFGAQAPWVTPQCCAPAIQ